MWVHNITRPERSNKYTGCLHMVFAKYLYFPLSLSSHICSKFSFIHLPSTKHNLKSIQSRQIQQFCPMTKGRQLEGKLSPSSKFANTHVSQFQKLICEVYFYKKHLLHINMQQTLTYSGRT
jgi:hypothetical protein